MTRDRSLRMLSRTGCRPTGCCFSTPAAAPRLARWRPSTASRSFTPSRMRRSESGAVHQLESCNLKHPVQTEADKPTKFRRSISMADADIAPVRQAQVLIGEATKQLDDELRALIVKTLAVKTRSYSSLGAKETGNAYQAVRLRDEILPGFRISDEEVWAGLDVAGRTVIDLGCNLGERTRLAVRAGASFAEGVEYEDLFVRIGGLISVYNVLIRQGDGTKPGCFDKTYDTVACFSALLGKLGRDRLEMYASLHP